MIKVNLLPNEIKDDINQSKKNGFVRKIFIFSVIFLILVGSIFVGLTIYFNAEYKLANDALAEKEKIIKKYGSLEDKSKKIAERIDNSKKIIDNTNIWSGVIEEIQKIMPAGITLKNIKMDSADKARGQIEGYATTKKEVAALRDAMDKSEKFEFVDIEKSITILEPISQKDEENFTVTFSLSKEALK